MLWVILACVKEGSLLKYLSTLSTPVGSEFVWVHACNGLLSPTRDLKREYRPSITQTLQSRIDLETLTGSQHIREDTLATYGS